MFYPFHASFSGGYEELGLHSNPSKTPYLRFWPAYAVLTIKLFEFARSAIFPAVGHPHEQNIPVQARLSFQSHRHRMRIHVFFIWYALQVFHIIKISTIYSHRIEFKHVISFNEQKPYPQGMVVFQPLEGGEFTLSLEEAKRVVPIR